MKASPTSKGNFTFARYLDGINAIPFYQQYKQRVRELLALEPGLRVLDVGCGAGNEARAISPFIQPNGYLVGVDTSPTMIREACQRCQISCTLTFCQGDTHHLPFPTNHFHRCYADKLCQYLQSPPQALADMVRVLKPGGKLILVEPDYTSQLLDLPDPEMARCLLDFRCSQQPHPNIAHQLGHLFRTVGLTQVTVEPMTWVATDYQVNRWLRFDIGVRLARKQGVISAAKAEQWLATLQEVRHTSHFFGAMTYFITAGYK